MTVIELVLSNKNVYLLDMFTFDAFPVGHSLSQTITRCTLFTLLLITQEYSFSQKNTNIKYRMRVFDCSSLYVFVNYFASRDSLSLLVFNIKSM